MDNSKILRNRSASPKDFKMDNPLQAEARGTGSILSIPTPYGVELLRSSGEEGTFFLPRAAFASLACKGLSTWKSFGLLFADFLNLMTLGRAFAEQSLLERK
jgi:hypothetical protein